MADPADIVTRLRAVLHNNRSFELMNREAADEIERLREELDTYFEAHDALLAQTIELSKDRDEARREVCDLKTFNFDNTISAYRYADLQKWDCYKDRTDD
jgi:hypothetical protein